MKTMPYILLCQLLILAGCSREPFAMTPVSGRVTYEDGSLIPIDLLCLQFLPQSSPIDDKTHPRPGMAMIDRATGTFQTATTHTYNDGLIRGKHKVVLATVGNSPLSTTLVPAEYLNPARTPLEVDTANLPFELKVRKPKR
jgi:hypothetical protein